MRAGTATAPESDAGHVITAGVGLAAAAACALWDSRFHVVPLADGAWRGISDPPSAMRIALSLLAGVLVAAAARLLPPRSRTPLFALALAAAPLVPVYTGLGLPLLALQGPVMVFVAAGAVALSLLRRAVARETLVLRAAGLFLAAFVFNCALATRIPGAAGPQGDEPHYLLMAQSLWSDGDLDLTDDLEGGEYSAFYSARLSGHVSENSPPGRLYSIHSPGLAFLILPGYALLGHRGAQIVLCAMAALAGVLVHRVTRAALDDEAAAITWALFTFTPPVPIYAVTIYPETPAILATAYFLWTARGRPGWRDALGAAVVAGALGWLHPKFVPLGALGLGFTLLRPCATRVRLAAGAVALILFAGVLWYFRAHYGTASLYAAIGPADLDLHRLPRNAAAMFFDRQFGLFSFSPVWLLALPGAVLLLRARSADVIRALALAAVPIGAGAAYVGWWGGAAPPARYVVPALPALALLAAPALRARKEAAAVLGVCGLVLVCLAAQAPRILHNRPDGESLLLRNVAPGVDLDTFLPSFFDAGPRAALLTLTLLAALALAWRLRCVGLALGAIAYLAVTAGLRDGPLIDQRLATGDVVERWDGDGSWAGPMGPPPVRRLAMPLELQRGPWVLGAGEYRNSRRTGLPPGAYRVELAASPTLEAPFRLQVLVFAGDLPLGEAILTEGQPRAAFPLMLPAGARQLGITAVGQSGRARFDEAILVPEALVPRSRRDAFAYPQTAAADRYRVGGPLVRATALDGSEPEDGGFRLAGGGGRFLVDGPGAGSARVEIRRTAPQGGDQIQWAGRTVGLGAGPQWEAVLPMAEGEDLGRGSVVPVEVRAPGAWVRFTAAP
jgi:hypothetical protein